MTDITQGHLDIARRLGQSAEAVAAAQQMSPTDAARFLGEPVEVMAEEFAGAGPGEYPSDGTVAEVLSWVGGDSDRARAALGIENGRDEPRRTLVAQLEKITEESDDDTDS